jgi:hypothetical protein
MEKVERTMEEAKSYVHESLKNRLENIWDIGIKIKTMWIEKPAAVSPTHAETSSDSRLSPSSPDLTGPKPLVFGEQGTKPVTSNIQNFSEKSEDEK